MGKYTEENDRQENLQGQTKLGMRRNTVGQGIKISAVRLEYFSYIV